MSTLWTHVLPNTPRRAKAGRKTKKIAASVFLGVCGVALGGGLCYFAVQWLTELLADRQIWTDGVPAEFGEVSGEERSNRFVFHTYELTLSYVDAEGVHREASQEFNTVFGEVDTESTPEIRYLAAEPNRAASSWSVDVSMSRGLWVVLAFAIGLFGWSIVGIALVAIRNAVLEERAAIEGIETRATISSVKSDEHGNTTYVFRAEVTRKPAGSRFAIARALLLPLSFDAATRSVRSCGSAAMTPGGGTSRPGISSLCRLGRRTRPVHPRTWKGSSSPSHWGAIRESADREGRMPSIVASSRSLSGSAMRNARRASLGSWSLLRDVLHQGLLERSLLRRMLEPAQRDEAFQGGIQRRRDPRRNQPLHRGPRSGCRHRRPHRSRRVLPHRAGRERDGMLGGRRR